LIGQVLGDASYTAFYMYGKHKSCGQGSIELFQKDFEMGSVILDREGGYYCLGEDIKFFPNNEDVLRANGKNPTQEKIGRVLPEQTIYPRPKYGSRLYSVEKYGVGFFAAVVIAANKVVFDLNGYTLE
jgi:hypothetical protein